MSLSQGWSLCQLDVNSVFFQSHLSEDVFMTQLSSFVDSNYINQTSQT